MRRSAGSAAQPGRTIGEALLDQRNLAGIGTIYRAETLFLRGVNPWRPVGEVPDLPGLVEMARRLLEANKARVETDHHRERALVAASCGSTAARASAAGVAARRSCGANSGRSSRSGRPCWCPRCQPL